MGPISGRTQELKELRPYMLPEQLSPCTSATEAPSSGACLPQLERVHAPQGKTPHAATKTQHIQNKLKKKKKKASQRKCHLSGKEVSLVAREEVGVVESNPSRRESKCKGPEVDTHAALGGTPGKLLSRMLSAGDKARCLKGRNSRELCCLVWKSERKGGVSEEN